MLSRRFPAVVAGPLFGSLLAVPLASAPAYAGTSTARRGVKVRANHKRDTLKYTMPARCARFDLGRGYVDTWASARKFKAAYWDEGSPSLTTGDWFDTTYDLVVRR